MTTFWWIRHGPTHRRGMIGWTDVPADLSDRDRLARLAECLPPDATVVSSDLCRATATADAIAGSRRRLPHHSGLREIHFGDWESLSFDEIEAMDPDLGRRYLDQPGDIAPPGGESWNDLAGRVDRAISTLAAEAEHLVLVAHFGPILTQLQRALGCSASEILAQRIENFSLTRITFDGRTWSADLINHHP